MKINPIMTEFTDEVHLSQDTNVDDEEDSSKTSTGLVIDMGGEEDDNTPSGEDSVEDRIFQLMSDRSFTGALGGSISVKNKKYPDIIGLNFIDEKGRIRCPVNMCRAVHMVKRERFLKGDGDQVPETEMAIKIVEMPDWMNKIRHKVVARCRECQLQVMLEGYLASFAFNSTANAARQNNAIAANALSNTVWLPMSVFSYIQEPEQIDLWQEAKQQKTMVATRTVFTPDENDDSDDDSGVFRNTKGNSSNDKAKKRKFDSKNGKYSSVQYTPTWRVNFDFAVNGYKGVTIHGVCVIFTHSSKNYCK